jgi:hypothetical protein
MSIKSMKNIFFGIAIFFIAQIELKAQTIPDSLLVKETVFNYIEGWYSADTARMNKGIHPDLAKRGIVPSRDGKQTMMLKASYKEMMGWTSQKPNQFKDNSVKPNQIKISIIEIGVNVAVVKCVSPEYIDYLHLARLKNEWKIINAIWEPNSKK